MKIANQFGIPYCVLLDSDKGTDEELKNVNNIDSLRNDGIVAYVTRKREPENYICIDCLNLPEGSSFAFNDTDDAKKLIAHETTIRPVDVLEKYWSLMSPEQIRESEKYSENSVDRYEFTEMFQDFFSLVD